MAVKCSADKFNTIAGVKPYVLNIKEYNETHHLWLTSVGLTEFQNGCHSHILFIQYSAVLALGDSILVSNSALNIK